MPRNTAGEQPTSVILPKDVKTRLRKEAQKRDLTLSQLLRRIVLDFFKTESDKGTSGK